MGESGNGGGFSEGVVGNTGVGDKVDGMNDVREMVGGFEFMGSHYSGNYDSNLIKQDNQG